MKTNPIPASGGKSVRALLGSEKPRRNSRKSLVNLILCGVPLGTFKGLILLSNCLGAILAAIVRTVGPPLARAAVTLTVFSVALVTLVHYGTQVTHGALHRASAFTDSAYEKVGRARTLVASLLPRFAEEDGAPRAQLVSLAAPVAPVTRGYANYPASPTERDVGEFSRPPGSFLDSIREVAETVTGLLPGIGDDGVAYPAPPGLPPIEGEVLAKAGGDRIQALISQVLDSMHQVEASGRLELVGDNGLAFGPLQVRHEPCEDLKKFFGATVVPKDCNGDWLLSEYVVRLYAGYWARELEKRTGETVRGEDILRIWNGGPDMGPMSKTDLYVAKAVKFDRKVANIAAVSK